MSVRRQTLELPLFDKARPPAEKLGNFSLPWETKVTHLANRTRQALAGFFKGKRRLQGPPGDGACETWGRAICRPNAARHAFFTNSKPILE